MDKIDLAKSVAPISYHNAAEIVRTRRGLKLWRVPMTWQKRFPEPTALRAQQTGGVELRFRADTRYIAIDMAATSHMAYATSLALYHGSRNVGLATVPSPRFRGRVVLLDIKEPVAHALDRPWRILLPYGAEVTLSALRLSPGTEILPAQSRSTRWLAHGDSITHGAHALHPGMTYVNRVADALEWDALNLGFGGAAWGDATVAEYIASRSDWDILSIAIGTNTYGQGTATAEEFGAIYARFIEIIRERHPLKPICCITPFWRSQDALPDGANRVGHTVEDYRQVIERVIRSKQGSDAALALMSGLEAISSEKGLTVDRLHPDAHGMERIAACLAPQLSRMLAASRTQRE